MADGKTVRSVAFGIIIGCIMAYLALFAFDKMGITFAAVSDQWGIFLSILMIIWIAVSTNNNFSIRRLATSIEKNTQEDRKRQDKIVELLQGQEKRISKLEWHINMNQKSTG